MYHEWGQKTPLRLPHRDPNAPWALPDEATLPMLVSTDQYWLTPDHLTETLIPGYAAQLADTQQGAEKAATTAGMGDEPAREASDQASTAPDDTGTAPEDRGVEEKPAQVRAAIRFDDQRSVVVDDDMIGYVLHQINTSHGQPTVSVKQLRELFKLEKAPAIQVLEALKSRQIITGEPRDGHYTYETVDAALAHNHLVAGAWAAAPAGTAETESSSRASQTADVEQGMLSPADPGAATATTGDERCPKTVTQPAQIPASVSAAGEVVSGGEFWHVTGIADGTTASVHNDPDATDADWTPEFELEAEAVRTSGGDGTHELVMHDRADGRAAGPVQQNGEVSQ